MSILFSPFTLRDVTLRNRIGMSPMCQYSSDEGLANDWHLVHLGARAAGGAGLITVEATAVEPEGRITPHDLGLWEHSQIEPLQRIVRFIHEQGAVPALQLAHAGRKGSKSRTWEGDSPLSPGEGGWEVVGPSTVAVGPTWQTPRALTVSEISRIREAFRSAASRAVSAGFRWIEIHAAHGYLLHSFLSPLSNLRTDEYGGSFENRTRFLLETVRAVRTSIPDSCVLAVRLSCSDWYDGGWTIEESVDLSRLLREDGVDLIDCSSGGTIPYATIPLEPGYQVPFAARIRREVGIATAAVGLIRDPIHAEEIISSGQADVVLLGRELLRNPSWVFQAAKVLQVAIDVPPPYHRM
jgi:2,4-dienoyl-CoA reductase-like NADH-dependent reductase (Old Yellow Enzyme family)